MSYLIKGGLALLSVGAISGGSYAIHHFSRDSFESKLGISVLKLTGNENQTEWTARLNELKAKSGVSSKLDSLKSKEWKDLQSWCYYNNSTKFTNEKDTSFQEFEEFCTWKIGDKNWTGKILSTVGDTHEDWKTAHTKLKEVEKNKLTPDLQEVWNAENTGDKDKKAMHGWCTSSYKNTWKGDKDQNFENVKTYCKKTS